MIRKRIAIENWRGLRDELVLDDLSPGLNVLLGPNEAGKSTVMDAVCRGFFDKHGTAGQDMLQRQPWGSELGPRVAIVFETGGQTYRLQKQFLVSPSSQLWVQRGGGWERLAEARPPTTRSWSCCPAAVRARGCPSPGTGAWAMSSGLSRARRRRSPWTGTSRPACSRCCG